MWQYQCHHQLKPMKPIQCFSRCAASNPCSMTGPLVTSKREPCSTTTWNKIQPTHGADLKLPTVSKCTGADMESCGLQSKEGGQCAHSTPKRVQMQHKEVVCTLNIASSYKFNEVMFRPSRWRNCWSKHSQTKCFQSLQYSVGASFSWETLLMNLPPSQTFCKRLTWISVAFLRWESNGSGLVLPNTCQLA